MRARSIALAGPTAIGVIWRRDRHRNNRVRAALHRGVGGRANCIGAAARASCIGAGFEIAGKSLRTIGGSDVTAGRSANTCRFDASQELAGADFILLLL